MNRPQALCMLLAVAIAACTTAAEAAQRTFVSTSGNDANPCSLVAPCRSFGQAIDATDANGEIVVLESGGYGRVTIDKSVTIQAPPGIYAGISVFVGEGVEIATPGIVVALRGITINGQGGQDGIVLTAGATLDIERCAIGHMTRYGLYVQADGADVSVKDSAVYDNAYTGVYLYGQSRALVERVRIENNANYGIHATDVSTLSIADSLIAGSVNTGLLFGNQLNGALMSLVMSGSRVESGAHNGIGVGTGVPGTLRVVATDNVISGNSTNGVVVSAAGGGTVVASMRGNTIAHNAMSGLLVNAGATLNVSDNVVVGNGLYGLQQSGTGVLNSLGNNVARDNTTGANAGVINLIGGV